MSKITLIILSLMMLSCTDAFIGKFKALGDSAKVECYSGGLLIYKGRSTGKISNESSSDGYYFIEQGTNRILEVSGNCIIIYKDEGEEK